MFHHATPSNIVTALIGGGFWTLLLIGVIGAFWGKKSNRFTNAPATIVSPGDL
jgi:hypothetical protein